MTEDEARAELARHTEWLREFNTRQAEAPQVLARAARLEGFLEGLAAGRAEDG